MPASSLRTLVSSLSARVRRHPVGACLLLMLCLYWPCLGGGYLMDDFVHLDIFGRDPALRPTDSLGLLNLFDFAGAHNREFVPWWATQGLQMRFWRPLSSCLGYLDHLLAPGNPVWAHAHSLAWLMGCVASMRFLLRETCDQGQPLISWVALMALFIFAVTGTHSFATFWIANRSALVATTLGFCAIGLYAKGQRSEHRGLDFASALCLLGSLSAGEIGWVCAIQLLCFAIWGDPRPRALKLRRLWPPAAIGLAFALCYGLQGYGARGGGYYLHPFADTWLFLLAAPGRLLQLVAHALAFVPVELTQSSASRRGVMLVGAAILMLVIWVYRRVLPECSPNHQRSLRWMSFAGILGVVPILGAQPNDRLLVPVMLSSSFFFATLIRYLGQRRANRLCLALLGLGMLRHFVLAPGLTLVMNLVLVQKSEAGNSAITALAQTLPKQDSAPLGIVINSPGPSMAWSFDEHLAYVAPAPLPTRAWAFGASARCDLKMVRVSPSAVELQAVDGETSLLNGLFGELLRSRLDHARDPLQEGQVITRALFEVEILELNAHHEPTRIRLEFNQSSALDEVLFFAWDGERLGTIELLPIGQTLEIPWHIGPMGV